MHSQINYSRIAHPSAPAGIIPRDELSLKLAENSAKKLILLNAPAGFGKSTLINYFLQNEQKAFGWIRLHNDINSSYILLLYIIEALRKINGEFGKETLNTLELLGNDPKKIISQEPALRSIISIFSNEFSFVFNNEITLVLDDLHELSSQSWLKSFIEQILHETPDNLKIIITTRYLTDINIASLKAKRNIFEITQKELALSPVEFSVLAKKLYNIDYTSDDASNLVKYMGGWVTGIHLLLQVSEPDNKADLKFAGALPENLFNFFAEEVFVLLEDDIKDFLLKTSFLEEFDAGFCDHLLNMTESQRIIDHLSGRNIFIETVRNSESSIPASAKYSYNQLFRGFLKEKAAVLPGIQLQGLYEEIAKLYYSNGASESAMEFYLLAGNEETALNILKDIFRDNFQQSNFEKLWNYVTAFSSVFNANDKYLNLYRGILLKYYKGNIDEALVSLNRAIGIDETHTELQFFISCVHLKAEILLTLGKGRINEAIEILNNVLSENASPLENAKTYHLLGNAYFNINKPDISETYLEKALAICASEPSPELEHDIYSMLGNIKIIKGDFVQSHHYYELALNKTNGLFKKIVILGNLTVLYSRSGKFNGAWNSLNKSKELLTKFRTPIFELIIKMSEYALWFEMGDYNSGLKFAGEIKEMALRSNSSNYIFLSYQFLGECSYYSGNPVKAIEYYNLSRKFIDESNEADEILLSLLIAISEIRQNLTYDAETKLLRAYTFLDAINSNYDKTIAGYYLAVFYLEKGNSDTAAKYFEKTLELASEKEYNSFLLREFLFSDKLFILPDSSAIHRNILSNIRLNILELTDTKWINNEYRAYLQDFIAGNYDIKMNIFGGVEFFVKNEPVTEGQWKRKKRKLILCCLLLNHGNSLSKDRIIDLFFRESSIENSDNLFHQAISNIRSALKSASTTVREISEKQYIVYEGKQLKIAPGISVFSDAAEFERLLEKASAEEETAVKTDLLKAAINLYKGEALEGYYEPWCEQVRSEFRAKYIKASESLLTNLFQAEQYEEVGKYSDRLLQSEPFNETANIISISSLCKSGKSARAKEKLQELRSLYKTELNENIPVQLERKFTALFE